MRTRKWVNVASGLLIAMTMVMAGLRPIEYVQAQSANVCPAGVNVVETSEWGERVALGRQDSAEYPISISSCRTINFLMQPGTVAEVTIQLLPSQAQTIDPIAGLVIGCNWSACPPGGTRLHHNPAGPESPPSVLRAQVPSSSTTNVQPSLQIFGLGNGSYRVTIRYGALVSPLQRAQANTPSTVVADPAKRGATGDYDHLPYADPSYLGNDAALIPPEEFDANLPGDAGGSLGEARDVTLGAGGLTLGSRHVLINNRLGSGTTPGQPVDLDDYYRFTVKAGGQVVIHAWPTRYDYYGGGITFWVLDAAGNPLSSWSQIAPEEQVFSAQSAAAPLVAYASPEAPSGWDDQVFYLRVRGDGFVRYSMTFDYVGNTIDGPAYYCYGPLTVGCGGAW